jgi:hypothetical protein
MIMVVKTGRRTQSSEIVIKGSGVGAQGSEFRKRQLMIDLRIDWSLNPEP